jgi:hypothetical protein
MGAGSSNVSRLQSLDAFWHIIAETSIPRVPFGLLLSIYNDAGHASIVDTQPMVCSAL